VPAGGATLGAVSSGVRARTITPRLPLRAEEFAPVTAVQPIGEAAPHPTAGSSPYLPAHEHRSATGSSRPGGPNSLDVTIVLPCYNEQEHVLEEVERISKAMDASELSYELLVIDDKSTDSTLAVLQSALPHYPAMRLMPFRRNGGSGTARRIGTSEAYGRIVVWTDADMTYPNERIPEFVQYLLDHPDVEQVVGARTTEKGTFKVLRVPAKWAIRKLAERLASTKIPDLNSGLRAFRRDTALPYLRLLPPGFSCVTTITMSFLSNQHPVDYLPIEYAKRAGTSKFHFLKDAYRYILQVLRMVMYFNPIKVLMPPALWLLLIGVVKAVVDVVRYDLRITTNAILLIVTGLLIASVALLADLIVRSRPD
jgi:polyisoprenyl-phosphate glycosyltransferase